MVTWHSVESTQIYMVLVLCSIIINMCLKLGNGMDQRGRLSDFELDDWKVLLMFELAQPHEQAAPLWSRYAWSLLKSQDSRGLKRRMSWEKRCWDLAKWQRPWGMWFPICEGWESQGVADDLISLPKDELKNIKLNNPIILEITTLLWYVTYHLPKDNLRLILAMPGGTTQRKAKQFDILLVVQWHSVLLKRIVWYRGLALVRWFFYW